MSIILLLFVPVCWALTARLLAVALSLSLPVGQGRGPIDFLRRWAVWLFPAVYLFLFCIGGSGSARDGVQLFGNEELFYLLSAAWLIVPILGGYVVLPIIIRDIARGLRAWRSPQSNP